MRTIGNILGGRLSTRPQIGQIDMTHALAGIKKSNPTTARNKRISDCEFDSEKFATTYLKHHFRKAFCEFHSYIFETFDKPTPPGGKREALIGPRKFGKTTLITLVKPLMELAYQRKHFILMVGESATAAEGNLATITQELETNELLLEDFPHLAGARDPKGQLVKWTDRQLVLQNHSTIMAKGMGSRMRGVKYRQYRPDLAILDDPESPETGDTFLKRRRHKRWFGGTFLGLGTSDWDIYVIGNLPNHDALIADLVLSKEWNGRMYRAINIPPRKDDRYPVGNTLHDGTSLWPEEWPMEALDAYKRQPEVGSLGFAREMLNDPREEEDKPFNPAMFSYFDFEPGHEKTYVMTGIAVDPAGGEKPQEYKKGIRDWCVILAGGRTKDGYIEFFDVTMTRKLPDDQIDLTLDMYEKWKVRKVIIEEIMFKNLYGPTFKKAARKRGLYPMLQILSVRKTNKQTRILGIQPLVNDADGAPVVRFARHLIEKHPEFFAQWDEFPQGHDDGPDAGETLIRGLEKSKTKATPKGIGGASYWKRSA